MIQALFPAVMFAGMVACWVGTYWAYDFIVEMHARLAYKIVLVPSVTLIALCAMRRLAQSMSIDRDSYAIQLMVWALLLAILVLGTMYIVLWLVSHRRNKGR